MVAPAAASQRKAGAGPRADVALPAGRAGRGRRTARGRPTPALRGRLAERDADLELLEQVAQPADLAGHHRHLVRQRQEDHAALGGELLRVRQQDGAVRRRTARPPAPRARTPRSARSGRRGPVQAADPRQRPRSRKYSASRGSPAMVSGSRSAVDSAALQQQIQPLVAADGPEEQQPLPTQPLVQGRGGRGRLRAATRRRAGPRRSAGAGRPGTPTARRAAGRCGRTGGRSPGTPGGSSGPTAAAARAAGRRAGGCCGRCRRSTCPAGGSAGTAPASDGLNSWKWTPATSGAALSQSRNSRSRRG